MQQLILASASPRRSAMLREIGVPFRTVPSAFVEAPHAPGLSPRRYVKANARGKALQVAAGLQEGIVIGADTIVVLDGRVLGKPASMDEARRYLNMLNGRSHDVLSGVCLAEAGCRGRMLVEAERTRVTFRRLNALEIERYLELIDPLDKAGAYAIQAHGALIVERIAGCYCNVVGFPLARLEAMLLQWGCSLFACIRSGMQLKKKGAIP